MLGLGNTLSGGIVPTAAAAYSNTYSIDFDGTNDYMISDSNISSTEGTYQFWIKNSVVASITPFYFETNWYFYMVSSGGNVLPWIIHPAGNKLYNSGSLLQDGNWHHILWTVSGGTGETTTFTMYIDGSSVATQAQTSTYSTPSSKLQVGHYGDGPCCRVTGNIDEVAIWHDVILDADAVAAVYNSGEPIDLSEDSGNYDNSSGLTHWWRMGDGDTHPTIEDNAGSNDMVMTNMASGDIEEDVPS